MALSRKAAGTYTAYIMSDSFEEWRRLSEHYTQMLDGELLQLANDYSDLTEVAQRALRDEMRKRGLGDPLDPKTLQQTPGHFQFDRGVELNGAEESTQKTKRARPRMSTHGRRNSACARPRSKPIK